MVEIKIGIKKKMDNYWIIFTVNEIKDRPYYYDKIIQVL